MANTSATGGPLLPIAPLPLEDDALDNFLHDWIAGITGLNNTLVRPRWQPEPPNIPAESVDWMAFGIISKEADTFPVEFHHSEVNGSDEFRRHQTLHILASFYGPHADSYLDLLRDGMFVSQNREVLNLNGMDVVACENTIKNPELIKEKWMNRIDLPFSMRRQIIRTYPVLNILAAEADINNEHYTTIDLIP